MQTAQPDSRLSWVRLAACLGLSTIGGVSMWSVVLVLPAVQAEFGADRGAASLSYTLLMLGVAIGNVAMGRVSDRFGIRLPLLVSWVALAGGYALAGLSGSLWQFSAVHFAVIGLLGGSVTFGPLMAYVSLWFRRRRGLAVALFATGNYIAGTVWPPVLQHFVNVAGWRATYVGVGAFCAASMLPLVLTLRGAPPDSTLESAAGARLDPRTTVAGSDRQAAALPLSPALLQGLLVVAGFACCAAMATPQVHIVAYCSDLGYGAARGAEMLALMLGLGIFSRIGSGWLADRIGGLRTLLLGSVLQGLALLLYVEFTGLQSLFLISALFGLVQGGIIPSYAVVVRESFPARDAGARIGIVLMATMTGMAAGGWMAGAVDDWAGGYRAAFGAGVLWNALNVAIVLALLLLRRRQGEGAGAAAAGQGAPTLPLRA